METLRERINSRKLAGMLWAFLILMSMYDLSLLTQGSEALYTKLMYGVVAIYMTYCGANVGSTFVTGKLPVPPPEPEPAPKPNQCPVCGGTPPEVKKKDG